MSKLPINPWIRMWIHPQKTVRSLVDTQPRYGFGFLSFLYGLPMSLVVMQVFNLASVIPLLGVILLTLILAPIFGMFCFYFISGLLFWTGKYLGGKASFLSLRAAVSWSYLPNILPAAGTLVLILLFKEFIFFRWSPGVIAEQAVFWYLLVMFLFPLVALIWEGVLLVFSVAEVQGFSLWKSILNLVLSIGVLFIAFMGLGVILGVLGGNV